MMMESNRKTLYWIRGDEKRAGLLRRAFEKRGVNTTLVSGLDGENTVYYGCAGYYCEECGDDSLTGYIVRSCGVELQAEAEEEFEPFDKVIGKKMNGTWRVDIFRQLNDGCVGEYNKYDCIGKTFDEIHLYDPWMKRYIGTDTPFDEWVKE